MYINVYYSNNLVSAGTRNRIGGVMVSVIASGFVDRGFDPPSLVKRKIMKSIFAVFSLSTQYKRVSTKTSWLGICSPFHKNS